MGGVNPWWDPPGDVQVDAWFDVWTMDDGSPASHLGQRDPDLPLATVKESLEAGLQAGGMLRR
ncbi:MAG: hypothetical protein ACRDYV_06130 [Acidimicrobiia bacterium]